MRSRYTAFVKRDIDYIERTCAKAAREEFNRAEIESHIDGMHLQGMEILQVTAGGEGDEQGTVDFIFHLEHEGKPYAQREIASFERIEGKWYYTDSVFNPKEEPARVERIGRNDPCSCGSGKKFKKCCGT
jgi:SEC-C motif-containing protein